MAAPGIEDPSYGLEAPLQAEEVGDEDLVFAAVQGRLGETVRLRNLRSLWRKDYEGPASDKRYVGGALLIELTIFTGDTFTRDELVVDDEMFDPEIKAQLEVQARRNWLSGIGWIRDVVRHPTDNP